MPPFLIQKLSYFLNVEKRDDKGNFSAEIGNDAAI